jgi:hypothetical protein
MYNRKQPENNYGNNQNNYNEDFEMNYNDEEKGKGNYK